MAILRAATGFFQADDALDLDLWPAPLHPDLVGQGQEVLEVIVGQLQDLEHLIAGQPPLAALEHLLARQCQYVRRCLRHRLVLLRSPT